MKKLLLIFIIFLAVKNSYGQLFPITQGIGNANTKVTVPSGGALSSSTLIPIPFVDTAAANSANYIKNYPGARIFTTSDSRVWIRNSARTAWVNDAINITGCYTLLSGGIVTWSGAGLVMDVSPATYVINCKTYNSQQSQVTLATADPTNPRIDIIAVDTNSSVVVITGTPAATPVKPQVNPNSQLELTSILIPSGAATPGGDVSQTVVYDQNTEWTASASGVTVNFSNTNNPFHLTIAADAGTIVNGNSVSFTNSTALNSGDYSALKFYIRLKTAFFSSPFLRRFFTIQFFSGVNAVTNQIAVGEGVYGFSNSVVGSYQIITIPFNQWTFSTPSFDRVSITFNTSNASGLYLDWVQLQGGGNGSNTGNSNSWLLSGNSGTNQFSNFLGTTDNKPIVIKTNNVIGARVDSNQFIQTNKIKALQVYEPEYEIVVFPDLQNMVPGGQPTRNAAGRSMFQWVKDSADDYNIQAIIGVGDMSEEGDNDPEWDTLNVWYDLLDDINMPYVTPPGNHDYNNRFTMFATGRDLTKYNANFGAARYTSKSYFVEAFRPNQLENSLYKFDVGSRKYAVISLEFFPTDSAMSWASDKCDSLWIADPERQVIITTHAYIRQQGERANDYSPSSVNAYPAGPGGVGADKSGVDIWEELGKKKPNIRYIFSGHFIKNGVHVGTGFTKRIVSAGENGNTVDQIYVNYQDASDYGNGYMMRLRFNPNTGTVTVMFWSAYEAQFDPLYPAYVIDDPAIQVSSSIGVANTVTISEDLRVDGRAKFQSLTKGFIPYVDFDGELKTNAALRFPIEDTLGNSILLGGATYDAISKVKVAGGLNVSGKHFGNDSMNIFADAVVGNNPFWFRAKHPGNSLTPPGGAVNTLFRMETVDNVNSGGNWWYNILRLRPPTGHGSNIYTSMEIGSNTTTYNSTYLRHAFRNTFADSNWFEINNNYGTSLFKFYSNGSAQFGAVESTPIERSAALDLRGTAWGFLTPRLSTAQQNGISAPANGLLIYNTDSSKHCYYSGSAWVCYGSGSGGGGGSGTVTSFAATDGNGFDFTVTNATTTPTLTATTTVTDDHIMVSNSGAISGSANFTYSGNTLTVQPASNNTNTIQANNAAGTGIIRIGSYPGAPTYGGMWFGNITPSSSNYGFLSDGSATFFNGPLLYFRIGDVNAIHVDASRRVGIGTTTPSQLLALGVNGGGSGTLGFNGSTSGSITIQPQAAAGTYNFNLPITSGNSGEALMSGGGGATAMAWLALADGTITPIGTAGSNVDAVTPYDLHYIRTGSRVTFSCTVDIDATVGSGSAIIELSLPVASNFSSTLDAAGVVTEGAAPSGTTGWIVASATNDRLVVTVTATTTSSRTYLLTGSYRIR
jgi:hypothetical protein